MRKIKNINKLPPEQWCDMRQDYEAGLTAHAIGQRYCCDERTAMRCILNNVASHEIGKQLAPTILDPYKELIDRILHAEPAGAGDICRFIQALGYTGSERTVRNYVNPIKHEYETQGHYGTGEYTGTILKGDNHHAAAKTNRTSDRNQPFR